MKKIMTVKLLIEELGSYDGNLEISYEKGLDSIELLIGEDPDGKRSGSITIPRLDW